MRHPTTDQSEDAVGQGIQHWHRPRPVWQYPLDKVSYFAFMLFSLKDWQAVARHLLFITLLRLTLLVFPYHAAVPCHSSIYGVSRCHGLSLQRIRLVDNPRPRRLRIAHWSNYKLKPLANSNRDTGILHTLTFYFNDAISIAVVHGVPSTLHNKPELKLKSSRFQVSFYHPRLIPNSSF